MLYNGQDYEELQEYFDNIDKPNYYYKYKKQFIRFKKNKVNPWDKLEHCINKFVGKTVDECWSYFIKHLNNVEGYGLQWLYNNVFLERHIGYNYKNYKHQFKDGVIQYAYGGEPKQKFKNISKTILELCPKYMGYPTPNRLNGILPKLSISELFTCISSVPNCPK